MENQNCEFSFTEMKSLYDNGMLKDHMDCKQYIAKFIFPLLNGTYALAEGENVTIMQKETINEVYLSRFPKDIKTWFKTETIPKKLVCDLSKPTLGDNYINISKTLKHKYEPYKSLDENTKLGVNQILNYIKEVWANSNEEVYSYLIKWLSEMVKGHKNKTCLYVKGLQGIGKSTIPEFIRDFVIGKNVTCKGKSDHLKGQHNLQLLGRIFVYFEELQFFSDKEWNAVDSELKDMITDTYGSYTDKYEKRFEAENLNNYMVLTNNNIKGVNGRRYLVIDISSKYMDNFEYFGNLRKSCFNDEVGKAFYCYLKEIDTENFNSLNMPETRNKNDIVVELLTPIEKFLKFCFVLRNANIHSKVKDIHEQFKMYDSKNENVSIQKFCTLMRELGFEFKKLNGYSVYKVSIEELTALAKKRKWLHELDEDELDADKNGNQQSMFVKDNAEYVRAEVYKKSQDEIELLKKYINKLEGECQELRNKVVVVIPYLENECKRLKELREEDMIYFNKRLDEIKNKNYKFEEMMRKFNCIIKKMDKWYEKQNKRTEKKRATSQNDFVELAEGVILNKVTNEELNIESINEIETDFFN